MKFKFIVVLVMFSGLFMACSDDESPSADLGGGDFLPLSEGNSWEYGGTIPYTMQVTGNTKDFDGRDFVELELDQLGNKSNSYVLVKDGDYLSVGFASTTQVDLILLKEDATVGTSWESEVNNSGLQTIYEFTMMAKGIEHTVSGEVFRDVIQVRLITFLNVFGDRVEVSSQNIYFAKGIGIIETDLGVLGNSRLIDYNIN